MHERDETADPKRAATILPRAETLPPGWSLPLPEALPEPTYWPAALALAITLFAWGFVTTFIISGIGLVLFVVALTGWMGGIRHEQQGS